MDNTKNTKKQNNVALQASKCCNAAVERTLKTLLHGGLLFKTYYYSCSKCRKVIREREYIINTYEKENRTSKKELSRYNIIFR